MKSLCNSTFTYFAYLTLLPKYDGMELRHLHVTASLKTLNYLWLKAGHQTSLVRYIIFAISAAKLDFIGFLGGFYWFLVVIYFLLVSWFISCSLGQKIPPQALHFSEAKTLSTHVLRIDTDFKINFWFLEQDINCRATNHTVAVSICTIVQTGSRK